MWQQIQSGRVNVKYLVDIEPVHSRIHDLMKQHGLQDVQVITTEEVEKLFNDITCVRSPSTENRMVVL
jgi:hypothetical protein